MTARTRVVVALAGTVAAVAGGPLGGGAVAAAALAALVVEGAAWRGLGALRGPALTVALALALAAWLDGRHAALLLGARVAGATGAAVWLICTVPAHQIVAAARGLGVPRVLVELLALAARYVSVLSESLRSAREAQRARLGWQRLGARVRSFGTLGGVVVARAVDQSVAVADAMRARGGARP